MDTFCTNSERKFRTAFTPNTFYHPPHYARTHRPNDFSFPNTTSPSRLSVVTPYGRKQDVLWSEPKNPDKRKRNQMCSIALTSAIFIVAIAVLTIAGLAFYMGALTTDTTNPLIAFTCSMKITRGDFYTTTLKYNYTSAFREKSRRYKYLLDTIYQKSLLGPAFVSCVIDRFKNVSLTIYFRLSFNRKQIPRSIPNAENTIKDILIKEVQSRKSVFKNIRIDVHSITVRRYLENDYYSTLYQRDDHITKPKETPANIKPSVIRKPSNITLTAKFPIRNKEPFFEEAEINEDTLPVVQGSFKITKTDADITVKRNQERNRATIIQTTRKVVTTVQPTTTRTTTTTKTTTEPTTNQNTPTILTTSTTKSPFVQPIFIDQPWKPIRTEHPDNIRRVGIAETTTLKPDDYSFEVPPKPIYQSFTNPSLSSQIRHTALLGTSELLPHPIPIDKFTEDIHISSIESSTNLDTDNQKMEDRMDDFVTEINSYVEIKTIKYVPGSATASDEIAPIYNTDTKVVVSSKWQLINGTEPKINNSANAPNKVYNDTLQAIMVTDQLNSTNLRHHPIIQNISTLFRLDSNISIPNIPNLNQSVIGHGLVEIINSSLQDLLSKRSETSTKLPLVTLIPVKSNSGLRKPLRPRPKMPNDDNFDPSQTRSFTSDYSLFKELTFQETEPELTTYYSELITSVTSEEKHVKMNRNDLFKLNIDSLINNTTKLDNVKNNTKIIVNVVSSVSNITNRKNYSDSVNNRFKKLAEISNIYENNITGLSEPVISTKAVSSSYSINQAGLKILTKTFNRIPSTYTKEEPKIVPAFNSIPLSIFTGNDTECTDFKVKCSDGTCLPQTTRCNQLMDCSDGSDERGCTCADYLRSQFLLRKICDGVVDCWDFSDENNCDWCSPGQYVCLNSRTCIGKEKICDGLRDCPHGDDERHCVTVAPNQNAADEFSYNSKGYLMIRKYGSWGKLCTENFERVVLNSHASWQISDLGRAVCRAMTYQDLDYIERIREAPVNKTDYYELAYTHQNKTKSNLSFQKCDCNSQEVVTVKCRTLECGTRPQTTNHWARIVGGTNANLGSWPWQAALYKEGEFQCGATLISEIWLVSAGHCFYHTQGDYWVARLGALRRGTTFPSPYEQLRPISKIILHPDYVDAGFINDISILRMATPVVFSDYVRPICLPPAKSELKNGRVCTVVGWGQLFEVGRIFPDTLQEVQLPVISTIECRKKTIFLPLYQVTDDMFCAGYDRGGRDACLGDSGGPLMCQENGNRWSLYGVTSNGYGCARANRPGVYTKVANYINWIESEMKNNETNNVHAGHAQHCKGHRCPLGECLPKSRLCNGYIECNDGSDEKDCF